MNDNGVITPEIIWYKDISIIVPILQEIELLIDQSPFCQAIRFLLANQHICRTPVLNKKGEQKPPNCLGTTFFIAGLSTLGYPYHAYHDEIDDYKKHPISGEEIPQGAFCFSPSWSLDGLDYHAGIYLGKVRDEPIFITQHYPGGQFGPEPLRNYLHPEYYAPETLVDELRVCY